MKKPARESSRRERSYADLETLHTRGCGGDDASQEKIAQLIHDYGFDFAKRYFGFSRSEARDFAQDLYLAYAARRSSIHHVRGWLLSVPGMLACELLRSRYRWRRGKALSVTGRHFENGSPEQEILDRLQARASMRALNKRDGLIVYLRIWRELPFADIARQVNLKAEHVKQLYYRALRKIAGVLEVSKMSR